MYTQRIWLRTRNPGESPIFYVTRVMVVQQLIEILALGKNIKVNTLLEGKKNVLEAKECFLENSYSIFKRILVLVLFTWLSVGHKPTVVNISLRILFLTVISFYVSLFCFLQKCCVNMLVQIKKIHVHPSKATLQRGRSPYN